MAHDAHSGRNLTAAAVTDVAILDTPGPKEAARRLARVAFVRAREAAGLTQEKLAEALDCSASTVKAWESESEAASKPVPYRLLLDARVPLGMRRALVAAVELEDADLCGSAVTELHGLLMVAGDVIREAAVALADGRIDTDEAVRLTALVLKAQKVLDRVLRALARVR